MGQHGSDLSTVLRDSGHRLTTQRQVVFEAVQSIDGHTTADEIYARVQRQSTAINRVTVYRTLEFLCSLGLITSTTTSGGHLTYELAAAEPHHHLICDTCGSVTTMSHSLVAPLLAAITQTFDFEVVDTLHLSLCGVCTTCREH